MDFANTQPSPSQSTRMWQCHSPTRPETLPTCGGGCERSERVGGLLADVSPPPNPPPSRAGQSHMTMSIFSPLLIPSPPVGEGASEASGWGDFCAVAPPPPNPPPSRGRAFSAAILGPFVIRPLNAPYAIALPSRGKALSAVIQRSSVIRLQNAPHAKALMPFQHQQAPSDA